MQGCTVILNNWNKFSTVFFLFKPLDCDYLIKSIIIFKLLCLNWKAFFAFLGSALWGMFLKAAREDGHHRPIAGVCSCCLWSSAIKFDRCRCEQAATGQTEFPPLHFNNCLKYSAMCTSRTLQVQLSVSWALGVVWYWRISNEVLGLCSQDCVWNLIWEFLSSKVQYVI